MYILKFLDLKKIQFVNVAVLSNLIRVPTSKGDFKQIYQHFLIKQ